MTEGTDITRVEQIEHCIFLMRGQKVMLDFHLAALYGVETKNLNKAVRRNQDRFPADFVFHLTAGELANLKFQFGTSSSTHGGRRKPVSAFTEQGVAMLSSVLRSERAIHVNVAIMRAFVRLRETLSLHKELAHKLTELERKIEGQDESIHTLFEAIRQLMTPAEQPRKEIGFHIKENSVPYRTTRKGKAYGRSARLQAVFLFLFCTGGNVNPHADVRFGKGPQGRFEKHIRGGHIRGLDGRAA